MPDSFFSETRVSKTDAFLSGIFCEKCVAFLWDELGWMSFNHNFLAKSVFLCINPRGHLYLYQTWVWLRVESWVDSESNAFRLSYELIWIEKMGKHFESWVSLIQYLGNPLESWVDSDSVTGKPVESWVKSIQVFEILLESWADSNEGTWQMPKKRSTKFSEIPKKVNEI